MTTVHFYADTDPVKFGPHLLETGDIPDSLLTENMVLRILGDCATGELPNTLNVPISLLYQPELWTISKNFLRIVLLSETMAEIKSPAGQALMLIEDRLIVIHARRQSPAIPSPYL